MEKIIELPENLNKYGFDYPDDEAINLDSIGDVQEFIRENFVMIKSISKSSTSYGLKHVVEDKLVRYVANGELIAAMILEGYSCQRCSPNSVNAYFNVSIKSIKKLYQE